MNAQGSVPAVEFRIKAIFDENGNKIKHPTISVELDGFNSGIIALGKLSDLYWLRDYIDDFISMLNIEKPVEEYALDTKREAEERKQFSDEL